MKPHVKAIAGVLGILLLAAAGVLYFEAQEKQREADALRESMLA